MEGTLLVSNVARLNLAGYATLVTTVTAGRDPVFLDSGNCEILITTLYYGCNQGWYGLLAFVVMPDHLHLICVPEKKNVSQSMHSLKSFSAAKINERRGTSGSLWQPSFRNFVIPSIGILINKVRYVHENPVRQGLAATPDAYPWSSANPKYATVLSRYLGLGEPRS